MANPEKGPVRKSLEWANYKWSQLTWRLDLAAIPFFALTGSGVGVVVSGIAYWWDRRSIREYKRERNQSLEPVNSWWDRLDPNKGSNRFANSLLRMAHVTA